MAVRSETRWNWKGSQGVVGWSTMTRFAAARRLRAEHKKCGPPKRAAPANLASRSTLLAARTARRSRGRRRFSRSRRRAVCRRSRRGRTISRRRRAVCRRCRRSRTISRRRRGIRRRRRAVSRRRRGAAVGGRSHLRASLRSLTSHLEPPVSRARQNDDRDKEKQTSSIHSSLHNMAVLVAIDPLAARVSQRGGLFTRQTAA